jgi:hypothetical protein
MVSDTIETKIRALEKKTLQKVSDLIKKPNKYKETILELYPKSLNTQALLMNLPMVLVKHGDERAAGLTEETIAKLRKNSDEWLKKRNQTNEKAQETKTYTPFDKLKEEATKNLKTKADHLVFALYFEQPPVRNDYVGMQVINAIKDAVDPDKNYYVRARKAFIFRNYKTKTKYGVVRIPASTEVHKAILKYVRQTKSNILLPGEDVSKILKDMSGETINGLRHSFISTWLKEKPRTPSEKAELAIHMLHSVSLQSEYEYFKEDPKKDPDIFFMG